MGFEMTVLRMLAFRPAAETVAPRAPAPAPAPRAANPATPSAVSAPSKPSGESAVPRGEQGRAPTAAAAASTDWAAALQALDLRGPARQLADHCDLQSKAGGAWQLVLPRDKEHLNTQQLRARIETALQEQYGRDLRLTITAGKPARPTPAEVRKANENQRMREAREAIEGDPTVKTVQAAFEAILEADSIRPTK
jgi:DNA polymerase-3 subunit gamma/tau